MLTKIQVDKLTHFFNILDHNGNGVLQEDDFKGVGENICITSDIEYGSDQYYKVIYKSKKLFLQFLKDLGKDNHEITLQDWITFFDEGVISNKDLGKLKFYIKLTVKYIFDLFDQNGDGRISIDEYLDMFTSYRIDVKFSAKSFLRLDTNRDEFISKEELLNAVFEFFISDDPDADGNWIFGNWNTTSEVYNI